LKCKNCVCGIPCNCTAMKKRYNIYSLCMD
jgi:hypothetical protein